ncbi:hypothetical protein [Williamsia sp.]|uniref:hypothetical protein n=1 Tax=Williamsia sp. TaxID=1872085 RepID=UPI0025CC101F|nr:hypothetical protein [Williamsia sp.]
MNWSAAPGAATDNAVNELITRLRAQMFRRGRGSWWYAEFTNETAEFTATDERPPVMLPLSAYADDIAESWVEPPAWLYRLWTAQSLTITEGAHGGGEASTSVTGLDAFAVVAGRWAAIAGAIFGMASDTERSADKLPIRTDMDGLWCSSVEGYHLRLTPLSEGRAVLSGVHSPVETTDPTSVVDGLPDWIGSLDLHPAIDHGALTICWWFDGTAWAASADAEFTDASHLPLPWVRSTEAAASVIEQVATSSGLAPDSAAVRDFVATSERDPYAARAKMVELF